ncbi:MAG: 16S rRNA (adenine(1518)-N(6)/adenine(1519)-N(6))-dimethyltransferase RsmA [Planctomycetota bacterium]|nr:16S rRNA (adenine(1518)-N(6)/adenine(1519)-N(6))-dimethyltransferase RsmA [Planctomycetota bacterium]
MQTIIEIRSLLAARGLRPRHRLGQNFLHDQNQLRKLIAAAQIAPGDLVLEIGPGTGTLTEALLEAGAKVIASEIDDDLADIVADRLGDRITLIRGDCLARGRVLAPAIVDAIDGRPFRLVANLPYQVASPLMTTLLLDHPNCAGQYVTIQKEVADRLLAAPGGKDYGPLGIIIAALAEVKRIGTVPPTCFWPQPQVTSAMVEILPSPPGRGAGGEGPPEVKLPDSPEARRAFARFVTNLFSKRRKQLGAIFGRDRPWPAGVTPDMRAEMLTVAQLVDLWRIAR